MFILGIVADKLAVFVNVAKVPLPVKCKAPPRVLRTLVDVVSNTIEFTYKLAIDKVPDVSVRTPHLNSVAPFIVSDCPLLIVRLVVFAEATVAVAVKFPLIVEPAVAVAKVTVPPTNVFPAIVRVEPPLPVKLIDGDATIVP